MGTPSFKVAPMIASAMEPWQIHLGARTILILHQDDAVMFVNMFSTKLEQLLKTSPKEGEPQVHKTGPGARSLAYTSLEEGSTSDRGIFLGDVTDPIVNCLRISLGLLALHQPVTA